MFAWATQQYEKAKYLALKTSLEQLHAKISADQTPELPLLENWATILGKAAAGAESMNNSAHRQELVHLIEQCHALLSNVIAKKIARLESKARGDEDWLLFNHSHDAQHQLAQAKRLGSRLGLNMTGQQHEQAYQQQNAEISPLSAAYNLLGLEPGCSAQDLRKAWRQAAKKAHPDHGGSNLDMAAINAAVGEIRQHNGWK